MKIKTLTEALLITFFLRLLLKGASFGDSLIVIGLLSYLGYCKYLVKMEIKDPSIELFEKIKALEDRTQKTESVLTAYKMITRK